MEDDTRTEAAWSSASHTDRLVFNLLSNSDRLDMERVPSVNFKTSSTEKRIEDVTEEMAGSDPGGGYNWVKDMQKDCPMGGGWGVEPPTTGDRVDGGVWGGEAAGVWEEHGMHLGVTVLLMHYQLLLVLK